MQAQIIKGFRLSPQQKHLWLLQQNSSAYCAQCAIQIEGKLNTKILKSALQKVVDRHEILRTTFHRQPGIKVPIQVITDGSTPSWHNVNISHLDLKQQEAKIEELLQSERELICNYEQGSLLRVSLLTRSDSQHILIVTLPSLCADSWSLKQLVQEIGRAYDACFKDEELLDEPVQYIQFSEWQNELLEEEDAESGKAYWQQQRFWELPPLTLPFEGQPSEKTRFAPAVYTLRIYPDLVANITANTDLINTTIAEFLFACWQTLLWRIAEYSDIAISTVFNGRKYEELYEVLGLLAKWLPVNYCFQENLKFTEVLSQIGEAWRDRENWQEYFLWEDSTGSAAEAEGFPISFEFEELSEKYNAGGVSFSIYQQYVCFERFKLKLTCVQRKESLTAEFHYDPELISKEAIECLAEQFEALVESAANNSEATISELNILSDRTRHQLLVELNNTQANYSQDKCIHKLFEQQVERTPDNIAVVFENQQLTYAELNRRANKIAHYLQQHSVVPETLVGIYAERSLDIIIAILGVLKAGGAYLTIDPALPAASLAFRLQDAQVPLFLTQKGLLKREDAQVPVLYLDADWELIAPESEANPNSELTTANLAYVLYTSGSTGQPKGVAIEHRQILNYLYAILDKLELPTPASFATVSTFAADLGNTAIFPALCTGGCLHIVSQERASDPKALADYFQRHPIDCLKIVPSHLATLLTSSASRSILPRQCLVLGGEAASWDLIAKIQQHAPNCRILNHYGPTETTVGVLTYPVKSKQVSYNAKTVPLGSPIANTQVYILDEKLQPVPIGISGELYIGGAGLARGYLNQPKLTAKKFISNPFKKAEVRSMKDETENPIHPTLREAAIASTSFTLHPSERLYKTGDQARYLPDGNIEFLGRLDHQVKIRGFRIELGEIEATLIQHSGVKQAVVLAREDESGNQRLVAYIVPSVETRLQNPKSKIQSPKSSDLRHFCLSKLSEYMVPSAFVLLKALPLTPNGKVDRYALPAPEPTRPELEDLYVAPRSPLESQLAEIWAQLLSLEKVGIHDNFFQLGGHSLLITQLLARLRDTFKVDLSLQSLFEQPTVANVAEKIAIAQRAELGTKIDTEDAINLKAEAVLDLTIRPDVIAYNPDVSPGAIFLTGATGFLGSFLLYELLHQTGADIYCLVRSENIESGRKKIKSSLESYLLWDESCSRRIIPVIGDLSQPLLGISPEQFQLLASQLHVIYHNGASVNFTYPYSALKAPNVLGTQEVLRLASLVKIKPVHFISTISVFSPSKSGVSLIREQDGIDDAKMPSSGYVQSKWVAEKLVTIARERGLPVCIYRPGRISGHSKTGACNPNDHTYRTIKGCIQLGSMPNEDMQLNLSPVDYVSQAIVYLSKQKDSLGKAFHPINPQALQLSEMASYIRSLGYPIELVSYDKWRSQLINAVDSSENALYPLISIFSEAASTANDTNSQVSQLPQIDCQNTLTGLAETSIVCPPVDAELLSTYFSYLIQTGFLNPPLQTKANGI